MHRHLAVALLIVACTLSTAACTPRPSLYADRPATEAHEVKVFAGDRLEIDHHAVTLSDAETPQPPPRAGCRAESMMAAHAADVVRSALTNASRIDVHPGGASGTSGLVSVDGLDLGLTLIDQGLAVSRRPVAMDWCLRGPTG